MLQVWISSKIKDKWCMLLLGERGWRGMCGGRGRGRARRADGKGIS